MEAQQFLEAPNLAIMSLMGALDPEVSYEPLTVTMRFSVMKDPVGLMMSIVKTSVPVKPGAEV